MTVAAPAAQVSADPPRTARRFAMAVFVVVACALGILIPLSSAHLSQGEGTRGTTTHLDSVLGPWIQFDAGWYRRVSEEGYSDAEVDNYNTHRESAAAFFPGYPLAVRAATPAAGGDPFLAEIAVTVACGALSAILFIIWCRRRLPDPAARLAVLALFLFPYSYYLVAAPYADAMFLAATLAAFLLAEDDRPVLAGLAGAVATATRPVGFGVCLGLVLVILERRGAFGRRPWQVLWSRVRRRDAAVLLSGLGVGGFMAYSWYRFGSPMAFSIAQRGWDQTLDLHTVLKLNFFDHLVNDDRHGYVLRLALQGVLAFVFLAAIPAVWRRFGAAYGVYTLVVLALPTIGSGMFISVGRYLLAAFPVFALAGEWLARRERRAVAALLGVSALGLAVIANYYGRSYFMS
jgi:hypothetical protein